MTSLMFAESCLMSKHKKKIRIMTSQEQVYQDVKIVRGDGNSGNHSNGSDNENLETDSNGNNLSDFNETEKILDGQYSDGSVAHSSPGEPEISADLSNSNGPVFEANDNNTPILHCHLCDFETYSQTTLQTHFKSHNTENRKVFQCDICCMKFSNGANMRRHRVRHSGVKPYECKICQKRFFRKDHLAEHMTTHNKKLPFQCPICSKGFQRQIAMRAHFQNEHIGHGEGQKSCGLCGYYAGSIKSLGMHMAKRHGIDLDSPTSLIKTENSFPSNANGNADGMVTRIIDNSGNVSIVPHHFLTPHVEISVASPSFNEKYEAGDYYNDGNYSPCPERKISPYSSPPQPTSSHAGSLRNSPIQSMASSSTDRPYADSDITPDISLIPIKQELCEDSIGTTEISELKDFENGLTGSAVSSTSASSQGKSFISSASSVSLIKVSPLKSLLREEPRSVLRSSHQTRSQRGIPPHVPGSAAFPIHKTTTQCYFCGIVFPDQTLYFLHKGCHSDSNPWKCNICSEQCQNVYDFNSHLLSKAHQ